MVRRSAERRHWPTQGRQIGCHERHHRPAGDHRLDRPGDPAAGVRRQQPRRSGPAPRPGGRSVAAKDTGLISILGVVYDAVLVAKINTAQSFNYTPYVVAGLLFVFVTVPMTRFTDWVARRQGWIGGGTV